MKSFLLISTLVLLTVLCHAQWVTNGLQLSTTPGDGYHQQIAMSKSNSAWEVWRGEDTVDYKGAIYLTGYDNMGDPLNGFTSGAIDICDSGNYDFPQIIVSSDSNIIVTWFGKADSTSNFSEIYMQKYTQTGVALWNDSIPVQVSLSDSSQNQYPKLASDLHGGVYICWTRYDYQGGGDPSSSKVLLQRIDSSGHVASGWSSAPVHIGDVANQNEWFPTMALTHAGDALYVQYIRSFYTEWLVRINAADGMPTTGFSTGSGVEISPGTGLLYPYFEADNFIFCDSLGNALSVWLEGRISENGEIYYQKTSATGVQSFGAAAKMIAGNTANGYDYLSASLDDDGSILAAWIDYVTDQDIGCVKFNTDGAFVWPHGSYTYPTTINHNSNYPKILPDHKGGSYIFYTISDGLFCFRLDSAGSLSWTLPGLNVGTCSFEDGSNPQYTFTIANVNSAQTDVTWEGAGSDDYVNVFACDVLPTEQSCFNAVPLGVTVANPASNAVTIYPNPSVNEFTVSIPQKNSSAPFYFELYNEIGMLVLSQSIIQTSAVVNTSALSSGFYFAKIFDDQGGCVDLKKIILQ